ncbi:MAG: hypothetical protein JWQ71_608 [Pedosphaera sp.]|nr:hypothetical protein [Pedosphaera sp.]
MHISSKHDAASINDMHHASMRLHKIPHVTARLKPGEETDRQQRQQTDLTHEPTQGKLLRFTFEGHCGDQHRNGAETRRKEYGKNWIKSLKQKTQLTC